MQFFIFFLLLSLFIILFCLYVTAREDIMFIRRNVTLEDLFNISILASLTGLFFSRLLYVILNPSSDYLNILVFLLFPYFPGLSFIGGVLGGALFVFLYTGYKKMPRGRIFDFLGLALLCAVPIGFLGTLFLYPQINIFESVFLPITYLILFLLCIFLVFPRLIRGELKNGSLGTLLLMTFSFVSLIIGLNKTGSEILYFFSIEDIISLIVVGISIIFFLKEEMFITKARK